MEAETRPRVVEAEAGLLPLSFAQEQLWFLDQLSPEENTYNVYGAYRLRGPLDPDVLRDALAIVLDRHGSLRTSVRAADGVPFQVVEPVEKVGMTVVDLAALPADEVAAALDEAVRAEAIAPFDLSVGPLHRFRLWRCAPDHHVFLFCLHHIITDGWSNAIIMRDLGLAYRALAENRPVELAEPELTYAEHALAQRERLHGDALEEELRYWERHLADLSVLELPTDRPRPTTSAPTGDVVTLEFTASLLSGLRALASRSGVSLFVVLSAAVITVLHRYTGQDDIPIGLPMLGRTEPELEGVVGLFTNMVVLRTDLTGDPTFAELLDRIADADLDAHDHQEVPFGTVVQRVPTVRDPARNPLFQVSVQLLDEGGVGRDLDLPGVTADLIPLPSARPIFDLVVDFFQRLESLHVRVAYATDLFDRWRIEALLRHVEHVLTAAVEDISTPLSRIPLLTDDERAELLAAGRGEPVRYPDEPMHVTVAKVAENDPRAVAAVCRGDELTYGELDSRAGDLAAYLHVRGVLPEQVVAIAMERGLDALVAILGVLKAGAAFTMIAPTQPAKRLDYILEDTGAPLVVTTKSLAADLPVSTVGRRVLIDADWKDIAAAGEPPEERATAGSLAYVLYTSGSTGQPKGVLVEHGALRCFTETYRLAFGLAPTDRMLQLAALTFDLSMGEIFCALTTGATLLLVSQEGESASELSALIREQRATYVGLLPAMLSLLDAQPYPDLRFVMAGGDVLPAELVNKWNLPGRRFRNFYGPTEAAVACTDYECAHEEWTSPPPIGFPHPNRLFYVVDRHDNLVPRGVPGELLIGGDSGLARGYLNQPELTAAAFIKDPVRATGRVYRSGDLVRWRADGALEFLGRIDDQVKLRGFRIEPGEIEAVLNSHPDVRMAIVRLSSGEQGEQRLVAYYTSVGDATPNPTDLRRHLADRLPEYMLPAAWVPLAKFPLTPARKIDYLALPEPVSNTRDRVVVEPSTATEAILVKMFAEVLALPLVSVEDNFFDLGGNSLQALRLLSRIGMQFGLKLKVRLLYGSSTIASIAAKIGADLAAFCGEDPLV